MMIRQGDVLVTPADAIPAGAKPVPRDNGRVILAYGEVTGHAHAITEPHVALLEVGDRRFLKVEEPAELHHEEHATLPVAPGVYEVIIQRELFQVAGVDAQDSFRPELGS